MAIAGYKPEVISTPNSDIELPELKDFSTALLDDTGLSMDSIIRYVEGSDWNVTYFSQVVGHDDEVIQNDMGLSDVLQTYTKINNLILKVTSSINPLQYVDNNSISSLGTAIYHNSIPPNVGDMFYAPLLNNNIGIYTVIEVRRKTYTKYTVYELKYRLNSIVDIDSNNIKDLHDKAVREYYYDPDLFGFIGSPLLTTTANNFRLNLKEAYTDMANYYFRLFLNNTYNTLLLPGQDSLTYDPFLMDFIFSVVNVNDSPFISKIRRISKEGLNTNHQTIYDLILNRSDKFKSVIAKKYSPVYTKWFNTDGRLFNPYFAGITYIMYPNDQQNTINSETIQSNYITPLKEVPITHVDLSLLENTTVNGVPLIPQVLDDTYYIFTNNFYNGGELTVIEQTVINYIKQNPIDMESFSVLLEKYKYWGYLEQFYYLPILMVIINSGINNINSIV